MVDCEFLKELARSPNPSVREHYTRAGTKIVRKEGWKEEL